MTGNSSDNVDIEGIKSYFLSIREFYRLIVLFILKSLKKYWYLLLIGAVTGILTGFLKHWNMEPYFEGTATFTYTELHKKTYGEMIDKLNKLTTSKSYQTLSENLQIPIKDAVKIIDIKAFNIYNTPLSEDLGKNMFPFYVWVKLSDRSIADSLLTRIESYLNNSAQLSVINANNVRQMKNKITFYTGELKKLDSLKNAYRIYMSEQKLNSASSVNTLNPITLYKESERIFDARSDLESAFQHYKAVKILDRFVMPDKPVKISLTHAILTNLLIGLAIAFFLALFAFAFKKS